MDMESKAQVSSGKKLILLATDNDYFLALKRFLSDKMKMIALNNGKGEYLLESLNSKDTKLLDIYRYIDQNVTEDERAKIKKAYGYLHDLKNAIREVLGSNGLLLPGWLPGPIKSLIENINDIHEASGQVPLQKPGTDQIKDLALKLRKLIAPEMKVELEAKQKAMA